MSRWGEPMPALCIEGDGRAAWAHGLCGTHYRRLQRSGTIPRRLTSRERFKSKVRRVGRCLEWQGARTKFGYGKFWDGERFVRAYQFAWRMAHPGESMPPEVRHTCDNPPCVRRSHLLGGTHRDNMNDRIERGTRRRKVA